MSNNILLIGAGGHSKACIEVMQNKGTYIIEGLLDDNKMGDNILGYSVIGDIVHLSDYITRQRNFVIAIGDQSKRKELFNYLKQREQSLPTIESQSSKCADDVIYGIGTIIMKCAIINSSVVIGDNCIINTGAIIEHDVSIGNHCHISSGSVITGGVTICDEVFVAANSTVYKNIEKKGVYAGNPVKQING